MIVHAPLVISEDQIQCGFCQNQKCMLSLYIRPCCCSAKMTFVHEKCLVEQIKSKNNDSSLISKNQEGYLSYNCSECRSQMMFKEGFRRELIKCSELGVDEKIMLFVGFLMAAICTSGYFFLAFYNKALVTAILLYPILSIILILVFYNLYYISTAQFWKRQISMESQINFNKPT